MLLGPYNVAQNLQPKGREMKGQKGDSDAERNLFPKRTRRNRAVMVCRNKALRIIIQE